MRYALSFKTLRKKRGLTQGNLAERVGVEQPTIQRWESGKQSPSLEDLDRLASALGVHPGELFADQDLPADDAATEAALREIVGAVLRSAAGTVPASASRPLADGLVRGIELLLRNPAIRTSPDALAVAVDAIASPSPVPSSVA